MALRVLRLCSVFEPPASALDGRGARFDPIGGMQDHTAVLTRALDRRAVDQVVVTTRPPTARWVEHLGPRATVIRLGLPTPRLRQLYALPAGVLVPALARHAHLVHAHLGEDLAIVPLAVLAAHRHNLPLVISIHCSLAHTLRVDSARSAVLATLGGWLERWGERRASATLVLTAGLADRVADTVGREHVHVVRRPVERDAFANPGPDPFPHLSGRSRIVFVGRLAPQKGVATLLEAFARLTTPGAQLVLVGDGPDREDLERQACGLGVRDRVHVTGFVPHSRIPAVLASADLLVLPSMYEEFGTVLVEAMQVGLPAVASRVGGIPEVLEDGATGLLVSPGDPQSLATAIDRVLADPELARRLGRSARRRAPDYDADRVGTEMRHLYARLIRDHRPRGCEGRRSSGAGSTT